MMNPLQNTSSTQREVTSLDTPVFLELGQGMDDAHVDVELGKQARNILTSIRFSLQFNWHSHYHNYVAKIRYQNRRLRIRFH